MHGSDGGRPDNPDGSFTLAPGEQLVRIFGHSGALIDAMGFKSSKGIQYGPWGGGGGGPYFYDGVITGFFGATNTGWGDVLGQIGIWFTPYAPAGMPPPPPVPGRSSSPLFGTGPGNQFDDGAAFSGDNGLHSAWIALFCHGCPALSGDNGLHSACFAMIYPSLSGDNGLHSVWFALVCHGLPCTLR
jgi:hypothetical protein